MNWKDIRTLYLRELRSALRERGIVVYSIIIPVVLYPLLIWLVYTAFSYANGQAAELKSHIMLRNLPPTHQALRRALQSDRTIEVEFSENPDEDLRTGNLDLIIDFVQVQDAPTLAEGNVGAHLKYDASRDESTTARTRVKRVLDRYRDRFIEREAEKLGITRSQWQGFRVDEVNVSSNTEMGRFILGLLLPVMLVIMLAMGAVYPAIDTTAGERENGTWETMMTTATSRENILVAKYLYVTTMSFVAGCLNVMAMMFTMRSNLALLGGPSGLSFQVPLASIPVIVAGAALLALFIAAGMLILASFARTFKEGQSLVSPFMIAFVLPLVFIQSPSQDFTTRIAFIPVVNVAMMFRQAISGYFDWKPIAITVGMEVLFVTAALKIATTLVEREDFMMDSSGGALLRRLRQWTRRGQEGEGPVAR
ncbi:MAG TPA: ABC transporter permease [Gemmatimonadaceae bacterium]|nr:ABC transporter permease [Gemmatimonadaceae bacterium]